jgi:D-tyrosyl-tRNA(Tyr) deacylase
MRVLVQRCDKASVKVDNKVVGQIDKGMMILVGFTDTDTSTNIDYMVDKVLNLRIYDDELGVMNKSILDSNGSILSVSQFTLYADTKKGRRPSYVNALNGEKSTLLYDEFNEKLRKHIHVETGIFGADMKVELINDGPVTIMLEK